MYNYIIGRIVDKQENMIVLECNNIGYELFVSSYAMRIFDGYTGENKVYTYYHQKEDGVALYGFYGLEEKEMFLLLITISGVGPKAAMAILSNIKPEELKNVIAKQDLKTLSSVKGIGKKTAERLLVELKDKVDVLPLEVVNDIRLESREVEDAVEVLTGLGLSRQEANKLANNCYVVGDSAENIISKALTQMRK